ncbi:hypothetical protein CULCFH20161_01790 [Corynebacterium ulcerans]|nr:hypothetical protein CULC0211_01780 [Corynebacterium ulcerans]BBJ73352.1 hypothetical protein CULCFH20161_01790 [Corynebacterium ulcerans]
MQGYVFVGFFVFSCLWDEFYFAGFAGGLGCCFVAVVVCSDVGVSSCDDSCDWEAFFFEFCEVCFALVEELALIAEESGLVVSFQKVFGFFVG